ncbi:unnamed protein product [Pylaiella littoralis]
MSYVPQQSNTAVATHSSPVLSAQSRPPYHALPLAATEHLAHMREQQPCAEYNTSTPDLGRGERRHLFTMGGALGPNVLKTGTPGTGKTCTSQQIAVSVHSRVRCDALAPTHHATRHKMHVRWVLVVSKLANVSAHRREVLRP